MRREELSMGSRYEAGIEDEAKQYRAITKAAAALSADKENSGLGRKDKQFCAVTADYKTLC